MGAWVKPLVFTTFTRVGAFSMSTVPFPVKSMLVEPMPTYPLWGGETSVKV